MVPRDELQSKPPGSSVTKLQDGFKFKSSSKSTHVKNDQQGARGVQSSALLMALGGSGSGYVHTAFELIVCLCVRACESLRGYGRFLATSACGCTCTV
mmetsp:Transcript_43502/g.139832  ORF Transcript_43502/g.139832 Transcript_43502/m.139832 type:complete len:98 (-) Transcript_43502:56-349(-)